MTFNPKSYAKRSDEVAENYEKRKQWREENKHLALPFFIEGLRPYVPDVYPEEMAVIFAPSGDGKTKMLKTWLRQAQNKISDSKLRAVTIYGSQEESTERLLADDIEKRGIQLASSLPSVFIGTSFGMNADDMEDLHMTNYLSSVNYASKGMFAEEMPVSAQFYDYIQATPNDPNNRNNVTDFAFRHQQNDNVKRLFHSAKVYKSPVITASQTGIKNLNTPYHKDIPIPGRGDCAESSGVYFTPDFVYSFVHMRNGSRVGKRITDDVWDFTVESNLLFFWFLKARGHNPETTAKGVGRAFPIRIINDEYVYDADHHNSMLKSGLSQ